MNVFAKTKLHHRLRAAKIFRRLALLTPVIGVCLFAPAEGGVRLELGMGGSPHLESTRTWNIPRNVQDALPAQGSFRIDDPDGLLAGQVLRLNFPDWLEARYDPASMKPRPVGANVEPGQPGSLTLALRPEVKILSTTNRGTFTVELVAEGRTEPVAKTEVPYTLVTTPPGFEIPERIMIAAAGMEGAMLFVSAPGCGRIHAVDVAAAKVVKTIEPQAARAFAAGKSVLVVATDGGRTLTRWNVPGFDAEFSRKLDTPVAQLWIGSGQDRLGFAAIRNGSEVNWSRLDLATLELQPAPIVGQPLRFRKEVVGRISANGAILSLCQDHEARWSPSAMLRGVAEGDLKMTPFSDKGFFAPNAAGTHFLLPRGEVVGVDGSRTKFPYIDEHVPYVDVPDVLYFSEARRAEEKISLFRAAPADRTSPLVVATVDNFTPIFGRWGIAGTPMQRYFPVHRLGKLAAITGDGHRMYFVNLGPGEPAAVTATPTPDRRMEPVANAGEPTTVKALATLTYTGATERGAPVGRVLLDLDPGFEPIQWTLSFNFTHNPGPRDTPVKVVLPDWLESNLPVAATVLGYNQLVKFRPRHPTPAAYTGPTNLASEIRFFVSGQPEPVATVPVSAYLFQSTPSVALPGKVRDACLAMDGRILLVSSAESNTVHAVDVVEGKIRGMAAVGGRFHFAGGKECLLTYKNEGTAKLARWSLPDLKLAAEVEHSEDIEGLLLGASQTRAALARGRLGNRTEWLRIDLATLRIQRETRPVTGDNGLLGLGVGQYRTSAFGHASALWYDSGSFAARLIRVSDRMINLTKPGARHGGAVLPSSRGDLFYAADSVLAEIPVSAPDPVERDGGRPAGIRDMQDPFASPVKPRAENLDWLVPSEDTDNVLKISLPSAASTNFPPVTGLTLMAPDGKTRLRQLPPMVGFRPGPQEYGRGRYDFGKRFWFSERLQVLAAVAEGEKKVMLASTKPSPSEVAAHVKPPLRVMSPPTEGFRPGSPFQFVLRSTGGSPPYAWRMVSGPPGMAVSPEGTLAWDAARHSSPERVEVKVEVRDATGGSANHTLRLVNVAVDPRIAGKGFSSSVPVADMGFVSVCHLADRSGSLVIDGEEAIRLDAAGQMTGPRITLTRTYVSLASRPNYLLALDGEGVDFLHPQTLAVLRRVPLAGHECYRLEAHPGGPVCYISATNLEKEESTERLYELQEDKGVFVEIRGFLGENPRVSPDGLRLFSSFSHSEVVGLKHHPFLGFMTQVERMNLLLAYDLSGPVVKCLAATSPGPLCSNLVVSPTADTVAYVALQGTTSDALVPAFDTRDPRQLKCKYPMPNEGVASFVYHPTHDLAVVGGFNSLKAFSGSTGAEVAVWPAEAPTGVRANWLGFSADGRFLLALAAPKLSQEGFLATMPIRLAGISARAPGPKPAAPTRHTGGAPVEGVLTAISGGKVMDPTLGLRRFAPATGLAETEAVRSPVLTRKITARQLAAATRGGVVLIQSGNSTCTGFFIGSSGYVLSCAHGVRAEKVTVRYMAGDKGGNAQEERPAVVVARDDRRDLCLMRLTATGSRPVPMILSRGRKVEMGEPVTVIGNPGAADGTVLDFTMSEGIVSSPNRLLGNQKLIQTSAAVNPGNSGGPLFDEFGNVIGVITSKADLENVGFAIPAEVVLEFLRECAGPPAPATK